MPQPIRHAGARVSSLAREMLAGLMLLPPPRRLFSRSALSPAPSRALCATLLALLLAAQALSACGSDDDDDAPLHAGSSGSSTLSDAGADSVGRGGNGNRGSAGKTANGESGASTTDNGTSGGGDGDGGTRSDPGRGGTAPVSEAGAPSGIDPDDQAALCAQFCEDEVATCTGDLQQYADEANCLAECAGWNRGFVGDMNGNTLDCRVYHLNAASADADAAILHCPHTGAHPAVYCTD